MGCEQATTGGIKPLKSHIGLIQRQVPPSTISARVGSKLSEVEVEMRMHKEAGVETIMERRSQQTNPS